MITKKEKACFLATLCAVFLCVGLVLVASGCSNNSASSGGAGQSGREAAENESAESDTRTFTDSLGRTVELPAQIDRIAPSGHTAQQVLLTIAPDRMVGLSMELTDEQLIIFGDEFADYPVLGAAFGAKGDMNREAVAAADPQVIIDTGEVKTGLEEDLDALEQQMGIPVVFIETKLDDYATAYQMLGELLGSEDRAQELSSYAQNAYDEVIDIMASIPESERTEIAYLLGDSGLNAIARGSFQAQVVDMVATNVVVVDDVRSTGMGNEISLEQIALWDPEIIVFQSESIYNTVGDEAAWSALSAIANNSYYEVPNNPWCWLNNPPTVNQIMGMQWLPRLLYPDKFDTTIEEVAVSYYKTFYNYDLSDAELNALLTNARP